MSLLSTFLSFSMSVYAFLPLQKSGVESFVSDTLMFKIENVKTLDHACVGAWSEMLCVSTSTFEPLEGF